MEEEIVTYLVEKYEPDLIILVGSQVVGDAVADSDWDVVLLKSGGDAISGGFYNVRGQVIDVTLKDWPKEGDTLTSPFGPLWPMKVLYERNEGNAQTLIALNKNEYENGPLHSKYKESCVKRFNKLQQWEYKVNRYSDDVFVQFYYAGVFYEFAIRSWFEMRNRWPQSPPRALRFFKENDAVFLQLLSDFVSNDGKERGAIARVIIDHIDDMA